MQGCLSEAESADDLGNAKRKVLVEDDGSNKKSCPHAREGVGRSAATPTGRLLDASSGPGSSTMDAKLHLIIGVDASAQGPIIPANRDLSPRVPGLHPEPGDEGDEAEGPIDVEPQPHPVDVDTINEARNEIDVPMSSVLFAAPLERIRVNDPVDPWDGMIPAHQGSLLRAANYPDGFSDPYVPLNVMSQRHVRLYWLCCVAKASLIAADQLDAFVWMDRMDDNAVAGSYINNEHEHHQARELFWKSQELFIGRMRVEANSRMDYQQSFAHLHCSIPEGGLSGFDVNTMLHRSAASRATQRDTRGWHHTRSNLYFDYEVYEMSDEDTEPGSPIETGSEKCDFLDHIGNLNRVSADKESITEELLRRRVRADQMRNSSVAAMLPWKVRKVIPPKWQVPQAAADLTDEQYRAIRDNEREIFMFDNGGYNPDDFALPKALSEIVNPEGALNGIHEALKAEFSRAFWEIDPEHRETLMTMEPVNY